MMKAIGFQQAGPITAPHALISFEAEKPVLRPHDVLVEIHGVSVNPVDTKVRALMGPEHGYKIIGYDAAGIVREIGTAVQNYKIGDAVFYAGDITRPGTNAELHAVDSRIVGRKPASLGFAEAAGLPLTAITAWELLFDSLKVAEGGGKGQSILIIGGAGGVGSILIQLAKKLTALTVITTASRPETEQWVKKMGADYVINHHHPLAEQMQQIGFAPDYIASLNGTQAHFPAMLDVIKPRGHIALIDDPDQLDIKPGKSKALSFSWEYKFARPAHDMADMDYQSNLLNRVSAMIDEGTLQSTVTNNLGRISAETLIEAHRLQETGRVIGKNVLDGFYV